MNYQQDDWMNWLAAAEFQYNDKKHAATGKTPFKLNFGRHPWKGDLMMKTDIPRVKDLVDYKKAGNRRPKQWRKRRRI